MLLRNDVKSGILLVVAALTFAACSDGTSPQRSQSLQLVQVPSSSAHSAEPLRRQPAVQLTDGLGVAVQRRGIVVTARITSSNATLINNTATTDSTGTARFEGLSIEGPTGAYSMHFHANNSGTDATAVVSLEEPLCEAGKGVPLDLDLGGFERFLTNDEQAPRCLEFYASRNAGQQYLVMFENIPRLGDFKGGLFPATTGPASPTTLSLNVAAAPATTASTVMSAMMRSAKLVTSAPRSNHSGWDFGDGALLEGNPAPPADASLLTVKVRAQNASGSAALHASLMSAIPSVGDTIQMYLAGIPRLKMADSVHTAVVRFISDDLIFAEDTRLRTTLTRSNGATNTPLTIAQMDTIAREYAAYARVQGERFFLGRFNNAAEAQASHVTVVHTLMYDENVWGYTYPNAGYFAFDYWVATNGSTGGNNQVLQRVADDLFMHEISHIRHYGMLERSTPTRVGKRGNQWLTEGFARFTERLPIAMRLLGTTAPSRTSNFVLARNPVFPGNAYFYDDVPTYLEAGSSVFDGYQSSSYVFDYFADQVSLKGGDYLAASRDVLVNGGVEADLDAAVGRWLPGMKFGELLTRARVALYTDDSGVALPQWTQYPQYQLRNSRPPGSRQASDPRNAWPKVSPGTVFAENRSILPGGAFGYLIDGSVSAVNTRILLSATSASNGVVSITRIR